MKYDRRNQEETPLYDSLKYHAFPDWQRPPVSFHVPGHKSGMAYPSWAMRDFGGILPLDLTELPHLDDLHQPTGAIAEAQRLAAECFGAEETFFLVGGSTVGNMAFLLSVCRPGDIVLVERNAHKSVLHGLMLAEAKAVFLPEAKDAWGPDPDTVRSIMDEYPDSKALFLTCPNYYGGYYDIASFVRLAHERGIPVCVDEAHGAHFGLHPDLPSSALSQGADVVVQSTHKMLQAMTMASMLHVQGGLAPRRTIAQYLRMLQSSSPSYPLMASLDIARQWAATEARAAIGQSLPALQALRAELRRHDWLGLAVDDRDAIDPYKLAIYDKTMRLTGFQLMEELSRDGVYAEMADPRHALLVFPLIEQTQAAHRLRTSINRIAEEHGLGRREAVVREAAEPFCVTGQDEAALQPVAFRRPGPDDRDEDIPLRSAEGRRSAGFVTPYPPGVPLLLPGERISRRRLEGLVSLLEAGGYVQGIAQDKNELTIRVMQGDC